MSKYEIDVWEYADEFKNLDTNETFYGYQVCELLEHKDQQISDLETKLAESNESHHKNIVELTKMVTEKDRKIEELKQQLHDLPKKIVEEIRRWGQKHYNWVGDGTGYDGQDYNECIGFNMAIDQLNEILDTILEKFGGKDE